MPFVTRLLHIPGWITRGSPVFVFARPVRDSFIKMILLMVGCLLLLQLTMTSLTHHQNDTSSLLGWGQASSTRKTAIDIAEIVRSHGTNFTSRTSSSSITAGFQSSALDSSVSSTHSVIYDSVKLSPGAAELSQMKLPPPESSLQSKTHSLDIHSSVTNDLYPRASLVWTKLANISMDSDLQSRSRMSSNDWRKRQRLKGMFLDSSRRAHKPVSVPQGRMNDHSADRADLNDNLQEYKVPLQSSQEDYLVSIQGKIGFSESDARAAMLLERLLDELNLPSTPSTTEAYDIVNPGASEEEESHSRKRLLWGNQLCPALPPNLGKFIR